MLVYRISSTEFAGDLEGIGAKLYGGRWNNKGTACVYTSASRALAVLEFASNVELEFLPEELSTTTYEVPDSEIYTLADNELPDDWKDIPSAVSTRNMGSALLKDPEVLCIRIPSVVVAQEFNYLINPESSKIKQISIIEVTKFDFDNRIKQ